MQDKNLIEFTKQIVGEQFNVVMAGLVKKYTVEQFNRIPRYGDVDHCVMFMALVNGDETSYFLTTYGQPETAVEFIYNVGPDGWHETEVGYRGNVEPTQLLHEALAYVTHAAITALQTDIA